MNLTKTSSWRYDPVRGWIRPVVVEDQKCKPCRKRKKI